MPRWPNKTLAERLEANSAIMPNGCREWQGSKLEKGYGQIKVNGKSTLAHRVAYELACGPVADDIDICHSCDNPPCIELGHLFPGTRLDNMQDAASKGRTGNRFNSEKTHCPKGHPYTDENTYVATGRSLKGERACRECKRENDRRRYWAAKEARPHGT